MDGGRLVIVLFPPLCDFQDYDFHEIHDKMTDFSREEEIHAFLDSEGLLDLLPTE